MADWEVITQGKVIGATTSNLDFTLIPGTYQHLEFTISGRIEQVNYTNVYCHLNGDSGANYSYAGWASTQSSSGAVFRTNAFEGTAGSGMVGYAAGNNYSTGAFSALSVIIPNYAETGQNKVLLSRGAQGSGGFIDGYTSAMATGFAYTTAITSATFFPYPSGGSVYWTAGTSYMLAGYKG
tara:strand:- start:3156 stop:3698 length:543 start_codon:yes stop_codon:yes gene_type:complete